LCFVRDLPPAATYALSLHDALPISRRWLPPALSGGRPRPRGGGLRAPRPPGDTPGGDRSRPAGRSYGLPRERGGGSSDTPGNLPDRKSTRLNSSHVKISYAVFCLKK